MQDIQVKDVKVLTGANVWAYKPVIEIIADIGKYEELPSNKLPGFTERLAQSIPSLWEHRCSEGQQGGFLERLRMGTYMGHIIEHISLELQLLAGLECGFGRTRSASRSGEYYIVLDYRDPEACEKAFYLAVEIAETFAEGRDLGFDLKERIADIHDTAERNMLGPSTQAIVDAARDRRIPALRLNDKSLVQLGQGKYAKRIQASETAFTSSIAVDIASNKELTKDLLSRFGVPVPEGRLVHGAEDAWDAAEKIGLPVVVKPRDGNQGRGVSVALTSEDQVRKAVALAEELSDDVLVERFIHGSEYRLLVINGKMVAAAQRRPAQVVGDGIHSIRELVEMVNSDPKRGAGHGAVLTRIKMDAAAELTLSKRQLTWESIARAGEVVILRECSNLSTGGTAADVTDAVHEHNARIAELASTVIGLDVAGVDIVCESIRKPLEDQKGAVVEVNAAPGLRMHIHPSQGRPRAVGKAIVDMLFPDNARARVPLIAVTGTNGKTTVTRMIAHIFSTMKEFVGMTTTDGVYFDGRRAVKGDCAGPRSAEAVLQHPNVSVAVLETARGGILRSGLAWDESTVSVVTNVAVDHVGLGGVETLEQLARVKQVIVECVSRDGYAVLNAEDSLVAEMADACPGKVIYFGMDCGAAPMNALLATGGRAVYLSNEHIVMAEGVKETVLMRASDIPATHDGVIPFQIQNAMAAAAAAWGAGAPLHAIRLGLRTFLADERIAPGRFNIFEVAGARVIVDYGHNPHALRAVQLCLARIQPRRAMAVLGAPGDRRDCDICEVGVVAADTFDHIIIREDDDLRERKQGEVPMLLEGAIRARRQSVRVDTIPNEYKAVEQALNVMEPGDLLVVFVEHVDAVLDQVKAYRTRKMQEARNTRCPWAPSPGVFVDADAQARGGPPPQMPRGNVIAEEAAKNEGNGRKG